MKWTRGDRIAVIGLVLAALGLIAAWLVVPGIGDWLANLLRLNGPETQNQARKAANAGGVKLSGLVTNQKSNYPIPGVNVNVAGGGAVHDAVTDARGQFVLQLTNDVKAGDVVTLTFAKTGYETTNYNELAGGGYAIPITLPPIAGGKGGGGPVSKGGPTARKGGTVEWTAVLANYWPQEGYNDVQVTMYYLSPSRDVQAPVALRLTFSGRILGEPRIQLLGGSAKTLVSPVSWSVVGQEEGTLTLKISTPSVSSHDTLVVTVTSKNDISLAGVTCVECTHP